MKSLPTICSRFHASGDLALRALGESVAFLFRTTIADGLNAKSFPKFCAVIISVIMTLACIGQEGFAVEFSVEGELVCTYFEKDTLKSSGTSRFSVSVKGCECWIRVDRRSAAIHSEEFWSSGTNSYNVTTHTNDGLTTILRRDPRTRQYESVRADAQPEPVNAATLVANAEAFPDQSKNFTTPLWLAFASSCVLAQQSGNDVMQAIFPLGEDIKARHLFASQYLKARTKWAKHSEAPFLLKNFEIVRDGKLYFSRQNILKEVKAPSWFKSHDAIYSYRVAEWTNAPGGTFPRRFQATRKTLHGSVTGAALQPAFDVALYEGQVTSIISTSVVSSFTPQIPKATRVIENRLASARPAVRGVDYMTTNGTILTTTEVKKLRKYENLLRNTVGRATTAPRWVTFAVLAVLFGLPLVLWTQRTIVAKKH